MKDNYRPQSAIAETLRGLQEEGKKGLSSLESYAANQKYKVGRRLAGRIYNLREDGYEILSTPEGVYKRYYLKEFAPADAV